MVSTKSQTIILAGPTASGKSQLAIDFARVAKSEFGKTVEIINADSVCFYQEFDIGSAKPTAAERQEVTHHLIDRVSPLENYHAADFYREASELITQIRGRGNIPLMVGGSGFYLKALRHGLWDAPATSPEFRKQLEPSSNADLFARLQSKDPTHAQKIGAEDRYRLIRALEIIELSGKTPTELQAQMDPEPRPEFPLWVIDREPEELRTRIRIRIQSMIERGWIDEVMGLRDRYPIARTLHAVGYQQVLDFLNGDEPEGRKVAPGISGLIDEIDLAHRQLAKSQRTFMKGLRPDLQIYLPRDEDLIYTQWKQWLHGNS